ncbi:hypothetical protein JB92DRAFT_2981119 [Gautieria morchelliformis]|nr:hypothetical protein JB92DRAFT_2981119 [Gautieria morchelliformis]
MASITTGQLEGIYQTRYFSAAGITILILDHTLTFNRERTLVWSLRGGYLKWAFLINRYIVPLVLILFVHLVSGISDLGLSDMLCQACTVMTCVVGLISMSVSNSLILWKVRKLWDGKERVIIATRLAFLVSQTGLLIALGFTAAELVSHNIHFNPLLTMCVITKPSVSWKGVWAISLSLDIFTFIMVCLNALSRPRGSHTLLTRELYRDGVFFFIVVFSLRCTNLALAILSDPSRLLLGVSFTWSLMTTLLSRMIMNFRLVEIITQLRVDEAAVSLMAA